MSDTPRPLREYLAGRFPMRDVDEYCAKCNHITPHTEVNLPDKIGWICKICDEVHTSKDPMDSCDE